jgi:divalent metal cation (Fe/Co/Zn/Cd) transporter
MERISLFGMKRSIETNSSSLKADAWHHRSDAITQQHLPISIALLMGDMNLLMIGLLLFGFICYNSYLYFRPL